MTTSDVAAVQRRLDRLALPGPQRLEAERLARDPLDPPVVGQAS